MWIEFATTNAWEIIKREGDWTYGDLQKEANCTCRG